MTLRRRGGMRARSWLLAILFGLILPGCGFDKDAAVDEQRALLDEAEATVSTDLGKDLKAMSRALDALPQALEDAGADKQARFQALDTVREHEGVSGLLWITPDDNEVWSGHPLPREAPSPRVPWADTFTSHSIRYHAGPFVNGLVVGPVPVAGGHAYASMRLEERAPSETTAAPLAERWGDPLGLRRIEILPPAEDTVPASTPPSVRRMHVGETAQGTRLQVRLQAPGTTALVERSEEKAHEFTVLGLALLIVFGTGALGVLIRRRWPDTALTWILIAGLILVARHLLLLLDWGSLGPHFEQAFSPERFSLDTPMNWWVSPADFAISALVLACVAGCMRRTLRHLDATRGSVAVRYATLRLAPIVAAILAALWLLLVRRAVLAGQVVFFEPTALIPGVVGTVMLVGLVALTATAYVLIALVLEYGWRAAPGTPRRWVRLGLALASVAATAALTASLGTGTVAALGLPLVASLLVGRRVVAERIALPSRLLLLSVLATGLLFPVLWATLQDRNQDDLSLHLDALLERETRSAAELEFALATWREDPLLQDELRGAVMGPRPEGLALSLWFQTPFRLRNDPGRIVVLDPSGRQYDAFRFGGVPDERLPGATAAARDSETLDVRPVRAPDGMRCLQGRVRIDDANGALLGHVVVTLPDLIELKIQGLAHQFTPLTPRSPVDPLSPVRDLEVAILRGDRVLQSSDATVSRAPGGFGPDSLASIPAKQPSLKWEDAQFQGYAMWSPARGATLALRRPHPRFTGILQALARALIVGLGLGVLAGVAVALAWVRRFEARLQHRILFSYLAISLLPLILLGFASARETHYRHDRNLEGRIQRDLQRVRGDMERLGPALFDSASRRLVLWASESRHDVLLYRDGILESSSRPGLAATEILPSRLPADVFTATTLEQRQVISPVALHAGRGAWIGYAPVLDDRGRSRATVAVPLLYESSRLDMTQNVTGSALIAGYLLACVLVLVAGIYTARSLTQPVTELAQGTRRVASGELDLVLPGEGPDEFGQLVRSFNHMTRGLREARETAAQSERETAWRRMARQVAHEIRNPLTPMQLVIQQMEASIQREPERASEIIQKMAPVVLSQIEALQRIAGDFSDFARMPKRNVSDVDMASLIEQVTTLHGGSARQGVTVSAEIAPKLPHVHWDEGELRRVLLNLVSNAVHAIETEGRVHVQARARGRGSEAGIEVTVADTGIGIRPSHVPRLFDPQFSTRTSGTGLGLAIVARIVNDMGGSIDVDSTPGQGSTFRLWCPLEPARAI